MTDGAKYWSYQPIQRVDVPVVRDEKWPRNAIDRFILARLEASGLRPVADADPTTLCRRVYFDLIGLPPTPQQVDAFLKDPASNRYERLVDRLLASEDFGRRWGRHWLDVARFGESITLRGYVFKDAWRYRDYVIDAFNSDRPYDRFMQEQVAGDLMKAEGIDERRRQLIATEFLTLGNINLEEQDKKQLEMDVVDEQINALGTAFLAQTIGCARCHDHKFDPIPTSDYYALAGILHSTQMLEHANLSKYLDTPLPVEPSRETALLKHEAAIAALEARVAEAKSALAKAPVETLKKGAKPTAIEIASLPGVVVDDTKAKRIGAWRESKSVSSFIGEGYLTDDGDRNESKTLTFLPELPEPGKYEVRFAYTPSSNRASNVQVSVFSADGDKTILVNEKESPTIDGHFVSLGHFNFDKNGQAYVLVSNEGVDGHVTADAVQFIPADAVAVVHPSAASAASHDTTPSLKQLEAELKKLVATGPKRDTIQSIRESKEIGDTRINQRGNIHSLGETAPRGFLHAVKVDHPPSIPAHESGRRELGEWLADPQNPLPARVMANRAWHWLFGVGIVRTVDNFGTTGELPSDPQLLDYLATRFVSNRWSIKSLIREIVLSHAYQLSTADNAANLASDPENRRVWRMNRRRLEAECIRDSMLAISGQLTPCTGGPTYKPGMTADFGYKQTEMCRSVYLPSFRNALPEVFEAFDCADPSVSMGRRNVSTVAPQALLMLNSPFVIEQSSAAATRLLADKDCTDDEARIERAYRLTLGRPPTPSERELMLSFLNESTDPKVKETAWSQVFHALFASFDFRYEN